MVLVIRQSRDVCPLLAENADFAFFKACFSRGFRYNA